MSEGLAFQTSHKIPPMQCPECGYTTPEVADIHHTISRGPRGGDLSVCADCGQVLIFNEDLTVHSITEEERKSFNQEALSAALQLSEMVKAGREQANKLKRELGDDDLRPSRMAVLSKKAHAMTKQALEGTSSYREAVELLTIAMAGVIAYRQTFQSHEPEGYAKDLAIAIFNNLMDKAIISGSITDDESGEGLSIATGDKDTYGQADDSEGTGGDSDQGAGTSKPH